MRFPATACFRTVCLRNPPRLAALKQYAATQQTALSSAADAFRAMHALDELRGPSMPGPGSAHAALESRIAALECFDTTRLENDRRFIREVIDPLELLLSSFAELRGGIRARDLAKLDYDARARKVRQLKESKSPDPRRLLHKEEKLRRTSEALAELTAQLYE